MKLSFFFVNMDSAKIILMMQGLSFKWKALFTVALGTIMSTMDTSITNISFPILCDTFKAKLATIMWVALAYNLVSTSLLLILGKISDLMGRKRIYTFGVCIFTLGLIACSLSQNIGQLIIFRMLQAMGGGMIMSCGTAIVTEAFPPQERGMGLGLHGVSVSIGFIIGPILGGFLLSWMNWRSIFYFRAPVGIIAFIIAIYFLKKDQATVEKIKLDLKGTILSSVGMALLILGLSQINKFGLKSVLVYFLIGLGLISLMGFIFTERRVKDPIIDLSLFKNPHFSLAIWGLFLISTTYPAFHLTMPFYLMHCIDLSASATGLLMTVTSMAVILFSPVSGWLSDRFGPVWFSTLGAVASIMAYYSAHRFGLETIFSSVIPVMALYGFGIGIFQPSNNSIIMGEVARSRLGTAAALVSLYRYMGLMMGTALAGTIFSLRRTLHETELIHQGINVGYAAKQSISFAFQDVLIVAICIGIIAAILSLAPIKLKK